MQLNKVVAQVTNVNPRKENHGDTHVFASDINLKIIAPKDALDQYLPGLSEFLFTEEGPRNQGAKVSIRSPIEPFTVTFEDFSQMQMFGSAFEVFSIDGIKVRVKGIDPMAGDQMGLTLQLQTNPDPRVAGMLDMMIKETVVISLSPQAVADEQQEAA